MEFVNYREIHLENNTNDLQSRPYVLSSNFGKRKHYFLLHSKKLLTFRCISQIKRRVLVLSLAVSVFIY